MLLALLLCTLLEIATLLEDAMLLAGAELLSGATLEDTRLDEDDACWEELGWLLLEIAGVLLETGAEDELRLLFIAALDE